MESCNIKKCLVSTYLWFCRQIYFSLNYSGDGVADNKPIQLYRYEDVSLVGIG